MNLRKLTSWLFKLLAGAMALLILLALAVILVNRKDEAPSQAVQTLKGIVDSRAPVADRDNAYVYVMGFSSAENADALLEGIARVEWMRKFLATAAPYQFPNLPGEKSDSFESREQEFKQFARTCKENNRACLVAMESDPVRLQAWIQREGKVVDRYESLLEFRQWRELWPSDARSLVAPFSPVLEAQRLMLVKGWLMANQGDAAGCKHMLERDLVFWRMVLAETSSLVHKIIATRAIEQHFAMGSVVLRRLPAGLAERSIPDAWRVPISVRERSMANVMANEWEFADRNIGPVHLAAYFQQNEGGPEADTFVSRTLTGILLKPQATSNISAERMLGIAELFDRDYTVMPGAAEALLASPKFAQELGVYNPVGKLLVNLIDMKALSNYGFHVANLEAVRRLALLASDFRSKGIRDESVAERLRKTDLRNPYDGSAFGWDSKERSLVFHRTQLAKPDLTIAY